MPGNTLIIPSGWIHGVFTPQDSLVFGGNFLHSRGARMQLSVLEGEDRIRINKKYRYPHSEETVFFLFSHIVKESTGREYIRPQSRNQQMDHREYVGVLFREKNMHERIPIRKDYDNGGCAWEPKWDETEEFLKSVKLLEPWDRGNEREKVVLESSGVETEADVDDGAILSPQKEMEMKDASEDEDEKAVNAENDMPGGHDDFFMDDHTFYHPASFGLDAGTGATSMYALPHSNLEPPLRVDKGTLVKLLHPLAVPELEHLVLHFLEKEKIELPEGLTRPYSLIRCIMKLLSKRREWTEEEGEYQLAPSVLPAEKNMQKMHQAKRKEEERRAAERKRKMELKMARKEEGDGESDSDYYPGGGKPKPKKARKTGETGGGGVGGGKMEKEEPFTAPRKRGRPRKGEQKEKSGKKREEKRVLPILSPPFSPVRVEENEGGEEEDAEEKKEEMEKKIEEEKRKKKQKMRRVKDRVRNEWRQLFVDTDPLPPDGQILYRPVDDRWMRSHSRMLGMECDESELNAGGAISRFRSISNLCKSSTAPKDDHIVHIADDGNCLFRALSWWVTGSEEQHAKMREKVVKFMFQFPDEFGEKMFGVTGLKYTMDIRKRMLNVGEWCTECEVYGAATLLGVDINIFSEGKWKAHRPLFEWTFAGGARVKRMTQPHERTRYGIYLKKDRDLHYDVVRFTELVALATVQEWKTKSLDLCGASNDGLITVFTKGFEAMADLLDNDDIRRALLAFDDQRKISMQAENSNPDPLREVMYGLCESLYLTLLQLTDKMDSVINKNNTILSLAESEAALASVKESLKKSFEFSTQSNDLLLSLITKALETMVVLLSEDADLKYIHGSLSIFHSQVIATSQFGDANTSRIRTIGFGFIESLQLTLHQAIYSLKDLTDRRSFPHHFN